MPVSKWVEGGRLRSSNITILCPISSDTGKRTLWMMIHELHTMRLTQKRTTEVVRHKASYTYTMYTLHRLIDAAIVGWMDMTIDETSSV